MGIGRLTKESTGDVKEIDLTFSHDTIAFYTVAFFLIVAAFVFTTFIALDLRISEPKPVINQSFRTEAWASPIKPALHNAQSGQSRRLDGDLKYAGGRRIAQALTIH